MVPGFSGHDELAFAAEQMGAAVAVVPGGDVAGLAGGLGGSRGRSAGWCGLNGYCFSDLL